MLEGISGGLIVAIVDFFMVFLVLGGLAGTIVLLRKFVAYWQETFGEIPAAPEPKAVPAVSQGPGEIPAETPAPVSDIRAQIAAILAALCEFTSLEPGTFKIDKIEPIATPLLSQPVPLNKAHIAAIAVAIHEFTSMPMGSLQITGIKHLSNATTWKMAGRMELMGTDSD